MNRQLIEKTLKCGLVTKIRNRQKSPCNVYITVFSRNQVCWHLTHFVRTGHIYHTYYLDVGDKYYYSVQWNRSNDIIVLMYDVRQSSLVFVRSDIDESTCNVLRKSVDLDMINETFWPEKDLARENVSNNEITQQYFTSLHYFIVLKKDMHFTTHDHI